MSEKDKDKKSLIERIDDNFIEFHKKLAIVWQNKTHTDKKYLEYIFYFGSATSFGLNVLYTKSIRGVLASVALISKDALTNLESELEKTPLYPVLKSSSEFTKYCNVGLYAVGIIFASLGIEDLFKGAIYENKEFVTEGIDRLTFSFGILSYMTAQYISKSNIKSPPKNETINPPKN
jgi:hypothetical protein